MKNRKITTNLISFIIAIGITLSGCSCQQSILKLDNCTDTNITDINDSRQKTDVKRGEIEDDFLKSPRNKGNKISSKNNNAPIDKAK